jgi:hypothetical protein
MHHSFCKSETSLNGSHVHGMKQLKHGRHTKWMVAGPQSFQNVNIASVSKQSSSVSPLEVHNLIQTQQQ